MSLESQPSIITADLYDAHHAAVWVIDLPFRSFGGISSFFGPCQTLRVLRDHTPVLAQVQTPGDGRVLVVDAGGFTDTGVMGDRLAGLAVAHGWRGVVICGAIRDSVAMRDLPLGVMALAATPRRGWETQPFELDCSIRLGGAVINPGMWIYADVDGILVAPVALNLPSV